MNSLPHDLLIIHYTDISQDPYQRLCILGCIGEFIGKPPGLYVLRDSSLSSYAWNSLIDWIKKGHTEAFWYVEPQGIRIAHSCQQHMLIGTNQLLADLKTEIVQQSTQSTEIDDIWLKARRYVEKEVVLEWINK